MSIRAENELPHAAAEDTALARALRGGLDLPLSALRAMLEALERDLDGDPRAAGVANALREVSKAGRAVRDLADYATAPRPMPLDCTVDEVVHGALARLSAEDRARVLVARFHAGIEVRTDAVLVSCALQRLFENAVEATAGPVMVSVRRELGRVHVVTINGDPRAELDPAQAARPFCSRKPRRLGLGLALARRDLWLCGGSLALARTPRGESVVTASVPAGRGEDA